ncbi:MAG: LysR family transcriptional regulator [Christensenella sp.]|uniref:LysR family transcriptional regulator n=1 Tax=Christensenella sp. TaxID=1935934 RepID=UPI002B208A62|nr:LysR family transcriptional regulator [Christensenella sp.]MEA5003229.1 LysR family transcriptional regulator [Christensenella sp.]
MLDFRIKTFLVVCERLNYTKAAQELNITQPAVSQHIRHLEEHYQTKLFAKNGKRIELTEAGDRLRNAMIAMKHDNLFLQKKLSDSPRKNELNFGVTLTVGEFVIPHSVARYLKKHPSTALRMEVANTRQLLGQLDEGDIDFALVEGYFAKNEYDYIVFRTEPYIAVCGKDYTFLKQPQAIEDLLGERLIVREAGSGTREVLEKCLEERNLQVDDFLNRVQISNLSTIKTLVQENCGVTFLYEAAVRKELEEGTLQKIELRNFNISHDLTFIWRSGSVFADDYRAIYDELNT